MRALIVGCGYLGLPLGMELVKQGHAVCGIRRTRWPEPDKKNSGIAPVLADVTRPKTLAGLAAAYDWVIFCVSSSGGGLEQYRRIYLQGLKNVLAWLAAAPPQKFVYTSSTSVYGQMDGETVDEYSPTDPVTGTAQVLVQAEAELMKETKSRAIPAIILRLAGIYGPGRCYWLKQYLEGKAVIEGDGRRLLNMIHRDDALGAVLAALHHGKAGEVYNVVDDEPVSQLGCLQWLSRRLGRGLPRSDTNPPSAAKRGLTNKRVSNQIGRAHV